VWSNDIWVSIYTNSIFHQHILTLTCTMGWLRLVGSLKSYVSFAKEPYKRDYILQRRPIISRGWSLLDVENLLPRSCLGCVEMYMTYTYIYMSTCLQSQRHVHVSNLYISISCFQEAAWSWHFKAWKKVCASLGLEKRIFAKEPLIIRLFCGILRGCRAVDVFAVLRKTALHPSQNAAKEPYN